MFKITLEYQQPH